jgi:coenzyme F420-reducing hydrogenase alpha subunit
VPKHRRKRQDVTIGGLAATREKPLDKLVHRVDEISSAADRELDKSAAAIATLRSTAEIEAEEVMGEKKHNSGFDDFLRGGTPGKTTE